MCATRNWNVLSWNVRGINSSSKWETIRHKIDESGCDIFCFQETKKADFDSAFLRNFAHRRFNKFHFVPSSGASGGLLTGWNGSLFDGSVVHSSRFSLTIQFTSSLNGQVLFLSNIYGPCTLEGKAAFLGWLQSLEAVNYNLWLLVGDFNLIRSLENRNKPGGNALGMFQFNEVINLLGLVEIPLKGRNFTWSNLQEDALLQKLDWVFTSAAWSLSFPNTLALPLARLTSDHIPCLVQISSSIPRAAVFRFENYWV